MTDAATSSRDAAAPAPANALCRFAWYEKGHVRDHKPEAPREGAPGQPRFPARLHKLDSGILAISCEIDGEQWNGRFTPIKPQVLAGPLILYRSHRKA